MTGTQNILKTFKIQQQANEQFSSVAQSCLTLRPHEPQYTKPPCPSPTPGVHSNPCPLCQWCHPTISSSVVPFSSYPQSFPASGSFQMSQLSASSGQSIGASASVSVLPMNIQGWFPLGLTDHLAVQGALKSLFQKHSSKATTLWHSTQPSLWSNSHLYSGKTVS